MEDDIEVTVGVTQTIEIRNQLEVLLVGDDTALILPDSDPMSLTVEDQSIVMEIDTPVVMEVAIPGLPGPPAPPELVDGDTVPAPGTVAPLYLRFGSDGTIYKGWF